MWQEITMTLTVLTLIWLYVSCLVMPFIQWFWRRPQFCSQSPCHNMQNMWPDLFSSPAHNVGHLKRACLVETISEHLAKLCHLSVSQEYNKWFTETRLLKSESRLNKYCLTLIKISELYYNISNNFAFKNMASESETWPMK